MYIINCAICDKPITDETEYEKTGMGLVCVGKCLDGVREYEAHEKLESLKQYTMDDLVVIFRAGQKDTGSYSDLHIKENLIPSCFHKLNKIQG